jgi:hypothetical protein
MRTAQNSPEHPSIGRIIHVNYQEMDCQAAVVTKVDYADIYYTRFPVNRLPVPSVVPLSAYGESWHWYIDCPMPKV